MHSNDPQVLVTRRVALRRSITAALAIIANDLLAGCMRPEAVAGGATETGEVHPPATTLPVPPTRIATATSAPATSTPVPTNTAVPLTSTSTQLPTNTPIPATATQLPSNTPVPLSPTHTVAPPTNTRSPSPTAPATASPTPPLPTATARPVPPSLPSPSATPSKTVSRVAKPPMVTVEQWGGRKPTKPFTSHTLQRITLHHEGVLFDGSIRAPQYLRGVQRWSMDDRGWPDLPYHFLLDLAGVIYVGRPITAVGDTNTMYDPTSHALIAVLGQYDEQRPNQAQIDAVVSLMAWIAYTFAIPLTHIAGHRDFIPVNKEGKHIDRRTNSEITCPGTHLYALLQNGTIDRAVHRRMAGG